MTTSAYSPGLEGVIAGISCISEIDTEKNVLSYRGYNVQDLCDHSSFEETSYLLLFGELPTSQQLTDFSEKLKSERDVPKAVLDVISKIPSTAEPMDWLKIAVTTLGILDPLADANSHDANLEKAIRLTAKLPAVLAHGYRILQSQPPVKADSSLSHAAHFLHLLSGEVPEPFAVEALNTTLILYAEHGFNASTFCARVTVSTQSDLHSGVVSAIGTLKGPLHGGANEEVMKMLLEIGTADHAREWIEKRLTKSPENPRPRVMGFGHREYKSGDQRAKIVKGYTQALADSLGDHRWTDIADVLEEYMITEKGLFPNLDFPVSPAYYMMGLPIPLYTPIFVLSRIVGWSAHIIEQLDNNRLIRPTNLYEGAQLKPFVPLADR